LVITCPSHLRKTGKVLGSNPNAVILFFPRPLATSFFFSGRRVAVDRVARLEGDEGVVGALAWVGREANIGVRRDALYSPASSFQPSAMALRSGSHSRVGAPERSNAVTRLVGHRPSGRGAVSCPGARAPASVSHAECVHAAEPFGAIYRVSITLLTGGTTKESCHQRREHRCERGRSERA